MYRSTATTVDVVLEPIDQIFQGLLWEFFKFILGGIWTVFTSPGSDCCTAVLQCAKWVAQSLNSVFPSLKIKYLKIPIYRLNSKYKIWSAHPRISFKLKHCCTFAGKSSNLCCLLKKSPFSTFRPDTRSFDPTRYTCNWFIVRGNHGCFSVLAVVHNTSNKEQKSKAVDGRWKIFSASNTEKTFIAMFNCWVWRISTEMADQILYLKFSL